MQDIYSKLWTYDDVLYVESHIDGNVSSTTYHRDDVYFTYSKSGKNLSEVLIVGQVNINNEILRIELNDKGNPLVFGSSINGYTGISDCHTILKNWKVASLISDCGGIDGALWYNGSGFPSNAIGQNNDMYIDVNSGNIYQKIAEVWSLVGNIKGIQGDTGPQGAQGVPGPQGEKGDKGDKGDQGDPGTGLNNTDDLPEGSTNFYYTDARVYDVIVNTLQASSGINIIPNFTNEITISANVSLQDATDTGNSTTNDIEFVGSAEAKFGSGGGILLANTSRLKEGSIDAGYGGYKGIAQICSVGYELKWEAGRLYIMNDGGTTIREVRYTFSSTPTVNDDDLKGFLVGSRWVLDNGDTYLCTDNTTGSAVWDLLPNGSQTLQQVTDQGSITTNTITVGDLLSSFSQIYNNAIGTENAVSGSYTYIDDTGNLGLHNGTVESNLKNTNVTNTGVILEFPNKTTGSYTIATTSDIPVSLGFEQNFLLMGA